MNANFVLFAAYVISPHRLGMMSELHKTVILPVCKDLPYTVLKGDRFSCVLIYPFALYFTLVVCALLSRLRLDVHLLGLLEERHISILFPITEHNFQCAKCHHRFLRDRKLESLCGAFFSIPLDHLWCKETHLSAFEEENCQ